MNKFEAVAGGVIHGLVILFSSFLAVATEIGGSHATLSDIGELTWAIIVVTGVVAGLKEIQVKWQAYRERERAATQTILQMRRNKQ